MTMDPNTQQRGLLDLIGLQKMQPGAQGETGRRFYQRPSFGRFLEALGAGANQLRANPDANYDRNMMARRKAQFERRQMADQQQKVLELAKGYGPRIQALAATSPEQAMQIIGRIEAQKAKPKAPKARTVIKGADGYNYYQDNGQRVLPDVQAKPGKPPTAQQNYDRAKAEGYEGTFTEFLKLGATNNIFGPQGTAFQKEMGKSQAETYGSYMTGASSARDAIASLNAMSDLIKDDNFYSGTGGESVLAVKKLATVLGSNPDLVTSTEAFNGLSKDVALKAMGGSLGAGFSNADRDFVLGIVPNLDNTPEGNKQLLQIQRGIQQRKITLAAEIERYVEVERSGKDMNGLEAHLAVWAEQQPSILPKDMNQNDGWGPAIVVE